MGRRETAMCLLCGSRSATAAQWPFCTQMDAAEYARRYALNGRMWCQACSAWVDPLDEDGLTHASRIHPGAEERE